MRPVARGNKKAYDHTACCNLASVWTTKHTYIAGVEFKERSVFLVSMIFRIHKEGSAGKCTKLCMENITKYFMHAQSVFEASPQGEGPGDA